MSVSRPDARPAMLGLAITAMLLAAPAMAQSNSHAGHAADAPVAQPADAHAQHDAAPAANAHDAHAQDAAATPAPPAGQRWATDAPLRDGMARIRQAVTMLEHVQHGHVDATQAPAFADQVQSAVNDMIANCKLAPDADAALHGLLVKFIAGAQAARTGPVTPEMLKPMQDALAQYPALFDDPDWDAATTD